MRNSATNWELLPLCSVAAAVWSSKTRAESLLTSLAGSIEASNTGTRRCQPSTLDGPAPTGTLALREPASARVVTQSAENAHLHHGSEDWCPVCSVAAVVLFRLPSLLLATRSFHPQVTSTPIHGMYPIPKAYMPRPWKVPLRVHPFR